MQISTFSKICREVLFIYLTKGLDIAKLCIRHFNLLDNHKREHNVDAYIFALTSLVHNVPTKAKYNRFPALKPYALRTNKHIPVCQDDYKCPAHCFS